MRIIDAKECAVVALGRLGENEYTVVRFDVSAWLSEYPEAVIGLYNQRPGDADAYPIAAIAVEDGVATWTVTSAELTKTGEGRCELVAIAGEVVAKSAIFRTMVFDALNGSGEAPEPWEEWQQQLIILKNKAEQAADRAEEAVEHYPRIVDGIWEVWDAQTCAFVSTGVQAQGESGDDGVTFTPTVSSEGVISWTNDGGLPNPQPVNIKGPQGDDYILTAADKEEIAQQAAESLAPVLAEKAAAIHTSAGPSDIVSILDAAAAPVDSLTVAIEPVQDLHGYDSPWPAGGGKNLIPYPYKDSLPLSRNGITFEDVGGGRIYMHGTAAGTIYMNLYGGSNTQIPDWVKPDTQYTLRPITVSQKYFCQFILYGSPSFTATGSTFTTPSDFSNYTGFALVIGVYTGAEIDANISPMLEYGATASAYAPYSNICPITGWTGAKVTRAGKNLLNPSLLFRVNANTFRTRFFTLQAGDYIFHRPIADNNKYSWYVRSVEAEAYSPFTSLVTGSQASTWGKFTLSKHSLVYVEFYNSNGIPDQTIVDLQLEVGSTRAAYEPYQGDTYNITFPSEAGTVYGGTLDVTTGVLTVDRATHKLASGEGNTYPSANGFRIDTASFTEGKMVAKTNSNGICNIFPRVTVSSETGVRFGLANNSQIYLTQVASIIGTTESEFDSYVSNNDVYVCYKLATPITYTLTPQEIRTLLGTNNIWADTGPIDAEYRADTKMYIDNKITQAIAAALNSAD